LTEISFLLLYSSDDVLFLFLSDLFFELTVSFYKCLVKLVKLTKFSLELTIFLLLSSNI